MRRRDQLVRPIGEGYSRRGIPRRKKEKKRADIRVANVQVHAAL